MAAMIECVPNVSEGKNQNTITSLVRAIQSIPNVVLLDRHSDPDHNRSVLTFVGPPEAVGKAAFQLAKTASELIDIRQHQGVHPRIGATDVIPFVPLQDANMDDCIQVAKSVGARMSHELAIPVFLYEHAATVVPRALEDVRRGSLEGLAERMRSDPDWAPDFGKPEAHPTAGITAIGARPILVAFNVNLASDDLAVAQTIARTIRTSNGGFKHVKAMGVCLEARGIVQVSMNLTNIDETPIHTVFKAIQQHAKHNGVAIAGSEVVGLVPERALEHTGDLDLKLEQFTDQHVLERQLQALMQ